MDKKQIILACILLCSAFLSIGMLTVGQGWGGDFASYIMQAESIARGDVNSYLSRTQHFITYPWGYPLLLSLPIFLFGKEFFVLKLLNTTIYILFLLCTHYLVRGRTNYKTAVILVSLLAFNPSVLVLHNEILSDIFFLFLSTLTIFLIDKIYFSKKATLKIKLRIILGLLIYSCFFTRTNGIILLPTLLVAQLASRQFKKDKFTITNNKMLIIELTPYLIFSTLNVFGHILFKKNLTNMDYFSFGNLTTFLNHMIYNAKLLSFFFGSLLVYSISFIFFLIGLKTIKTKDWHLLMFMILTISIYITWPDEQGLRLYFPIISYYLLFAIRGSYLIANKFISKRRLFNHLTIYWYFLIIIFLFYSVQLVVANLKNNRRQSGPYDQISAQMFDYINKNVKPNETVGSIRPRVVTLITGKRAVLTLEADKMMQVNYIIFHKENSRYYASTRRLVDQRFINNVFENQNFIIYKVNN
jgi:hypothetical protein